MGKIGTWLYRYLKWYRLNLENFSVASVWVLLHIHVIVENVWYEVLLDLSKKSTFCQRPHDPSREQFLQIPVFRRSLVGSFLHNDRKREVGMAFFSFLNLTNMKRGNGPLFCALRHLETYFRLEPMKQQQNLASINHHLHVCTFRN